MNGKIAYKDLLLKIIMAPPLFSYFGGLMRTSALKRIVLSALLLCVAQVCLLSSAQAQKLVAYSWGTNNEGQLGSGLLR